MPEQPTHAESHQYPGDQPAQPVEWNDGTDSKRNGNRPPHGQDMAQGQRQQR